MCGIFSLIQCADTASPSTAPLVAGTSRVRHRGPDDAGYLLWRRGQQPRVYAGPETAAATRDAHRLPELPGSEQWTVALGHRRLSILDLSPAGHQPLIHGPTGLAISYNGEIYNHAELRRELEQRGHRFVSHCDTEVLLSAWAEWGPGCLDRLNGMFAFVLLDPREGGTLHAVRDRFGVKPLYWARVGGLLAFASEIKQIRALPDYRFALDEGAARDYLEAGLLDHTRHTLHAGIEQLRGGERAVVPLHGRMRHVHVERWYDLRERRLARGSDAADEFRELFTDSVRLRLRADVPVGSCLSGGLDSSAIVCVARRVLEEQGADPGQVTVTARYAEAACDEWSFAEQVVRRTGARAVEVWPDVARLQHELDAQLWHMDEPFGSTSQFSQWCVFGAAADAGLKVMLDGQGSDEQLAGYPGSEAALYAGMLRRGRLLPLLRDVRAARERLGALPVAQLLLAARSTVPAIDRVLPEQLRPVARGPEWLRLSADSPYEPPPIRALGDGLREQTLVTSLPMLLRYEDRNSMAFSIESRVPFLDYRLVEMLAGLPDDQKIHRGVTKVVLRRGMDGIIPDAVRDRRDKMGFVTPERLWLTRQAADWFRRGVRAAADAAPDVIDGASVMRMVDDVATGRVPFSFTPWRILCFGRWLTIAARDEVPEVPAAPCTSAA